jgi:hypothetical protein
MDSYCHGFAVLASPFGFHVPQREIVVFPCSILHFFFASFHVHYPSAFITDTALWRFHITETVLNN